MRNVLIALAVVAQAAPAAADTGCTLHLTPGRAHVAELHCVNRLADQVLATRLDLIEDGLRVGVVIFHEDGTIPDQFIVTVPDGFWADPADVEIMENREEVILIYEWTGS